MTYKEPKSKDYKKRANKRFKNESHCQIAIITMFHYDEVLTWELNL